MPTVLFHTGFLFLLGYDIVDLLLILIWGFEIVLDVFMLVVCVSVCARVCVCVNASCAVDSLPNIK